jgi:RHS repeat-associated protein
MKQSIFAQAISCLLCLSFLMNHPERAQASPAPLPGRSCASVPVSVSYSSISLSKSKCGFGSWEPSTPPKYYLTNTITEAAQSKTITDTLDGFGLLEMGRVAVPGSALFETSSSWEDSQWVNVLFFADYNSTNPGIAARYNFTLSGTNTDTGSDTDTKTLTLAKDDDPAISSGTYFDMSTDASITFTPDPTSGKVVQGYPATALDCPMTTTTVSPLAWPILTEGTFEIQGLEKTFIPAAGTPYQQINTLSVENTDTVLDGNARVILNSSNYVGWGKDYYLNTGSTNGNLTLARRALTPDYGPVALSKFAYKFSFPTETNVSYQLDWNVVTVYESGTRQATNELHKTVTGDGTFMTVDTDDNGQTLEVQPPTENGTNTIQSVSCKPIQGCNGSCSAGAGGGGAGPGGMGSGGGPGSAPGSGSTGLSSIDVNIFLGNNVDGRSAGTLYLKGGLSTDCLARQQNLRYSGWKNPGVDVVTDGSGIRQLKTFQALADVVSITDGYQVNFYTTGVKSGGIYTPSGSAFASWAFTNPGGDTTTLRVAQTFEGETKTWNYLYLGEGHWKLQYPNGAGDEEVLESWNSSTLNLTKFRAWHGPGGGPSRRETSEIYHQFSFGEELVQRTEGTGTDAKTTSYTYGSSGSPNGTYVPLQWMTDSTGYWEFYTYDSSTLLPKEVYRQFGNAPSSAVPSDSSGFRLTSYGYTPWATGDDGSGEPFTPRAITNWVQGTIVSIQRTAILADTNGYLTEKREEFYGNGGAVEYTTNYYTGGQLTSTTHRDGTRSIYSYAVDSTNTLTTTISTGAVNPTAPGTITNGTQTTLVQGFQAGDIKTNLVVDIASGLTIQKDIYQRDYLLRATNITYLDGTSKSMVYDCCGLSSVTDRDGLTTVFTYDDLKRLHTTTRAGVTATDNYDAAGNLVSRVRTGSENHSITMETSIYDLGGVLRTNYNALGKPTMYSETGNGTNKITTLANSATRTESFNGDGTLYRVSGSAAHPVQYQYGVDSGMQFAKEIKLAADGSTNEWQATYTDNFGRNSQTVFSDGQAIHYYYNTKGQLTNEVDSDGVSKIYIYNAKGEMEYTVLDYNRDHVIDWTGPDRISRTLTDFTTSSGALPGVAARRTRTWVYDTSSSTPSLVSEECVSLTNLQSASIRYGLTNKTVVTLSGTNRTETTTLPDGSFTVNLYSDGRLASSTRQDNSGNQLYVTTYVYDEYGRQKQVVDGRNGARTYVFNDDDSVQSVTSPFPGTGQGAQTTSYAYDDLGRVLQTTMPDNTVVTNQYYDTGELMVTAGSRTYPVGYGYDAQGRMTAMTNWTNFRTEGERVTRWIYGNQRGFLAAKTYAEPTTNGPGYTYTSAGRLATRTWARGTTATYAQNNAGQVSAVTYSDGTPQLTLNYDRLGRVTNAVRTGVSTNAISYNLAGEIITDMQNGLLVTNNYDGLLRRTIMKYSFLTGTVVSYGYDSFSRIVGVTNNFSTTYSYLPKSSLVGSIAYKQAGTTRMTTTKQYDNLNRLSAIASTPSADSPISFNYLYNDANERTRVDTSYPASPSRWAYGYDNLGQVTSGKRYWTDNTPVAGQQFEYSYDDIGNRLETRSGGDSGGSNLRVAGYTNNSLNQLTSRGVPGTLDVMGTALSTASVTVNGQAASRKGAYFDAAVPVSNGTTNVYQAITNTISDGVTTFTTNGNLFLAQNAEVMGYDLDGNMTNDGRWILTWDGENRLIRMTSTNVVDAAKKTIVFSYDWRGRRMSKTVSNWVSGAWQVGNSERYIYDNWNLFAIFPASSPTWKMSYTWGPDLSGSMQGAGGVGGLLGMRDGNNGTNYFCAYDGNGNVAGFVNANNGFLSAQYEYDPFGNVLRATGYLSQTNTVRFSSKMQDPESGWSYYGYRYYNPSSGKWVSKDPIEEMGGMNIYSFVANNSSGSVDSNGDKGFGTVGVLNPKNLEPVVELLEEAEGLRRLPPYIPPPPPNPNKEQDPRTKPKIPWIPPVWKSTDKACKCTFKRVPPKGGDTYHNEYAAFLQNGEKMDFLVYAPTLKQSYQYDAAVRVEGVVRAYDAKTKHSFLLAPDVNPKAIQERNDDFKRALAVARECGLQFVIAVDNRAGYDGLLRHFPGYDIRYIPFTK